MLMVVFGAGASYGSVPEPYWTAMMHAEERQPPLAAELLDPRDPFVEALRRFSQCAGLVASLRSRLGDESIEDALQREYLQAANGAHEQRAFWAFRFYLHEVISHCSPWGALAGATNYDALARRLESWRPEHEPVALVTFNYDRILEGALTRILGFQYSAIDDWTSSELPIFKLHGCIGWWRDIGLSQPADSSVIDLAPARWEKEGQFHIAKSSQAIHQLLPAISVPVKDKNTYQCPQPHLEKLGALIPEVHRVLVIGWRGFEENFLDLLAKGLPNGVRGLVVGSGLDGATETALHLQQKLPGTWEAADILGFTGLIAQDPVIRAWWQG